MNDQRFFDLAMKVIARQANDAERADLDALLAREAELRAKFTRLEKDALVAKNDVAERRHRGTYAIKTGDGT